MDGCVWMYTQTISMTGGRVAHGCCYSQQQQSTVRGVYGRWMGHHWLMPAQHSTAQRGKQRVWRVMAAHNSLFCVQAMPCGAAIRATWRTRRLGTLKRLLLNALEGDRGAARQRARLRAQRAGMLLNHVSSLGAGVHVQPVNVGLI